MKLMRKGKVKDIYELENGNLLFHFSDRISAFDIQMTNLVPRKGEVLCKFTEFWFNSLNAKNHMIRLHDKDKMEVKRLEMIPIECVVRGYLYGSLFERLSKSTNDNTISGNFTPIKAARLPNPVFDPTTKSEEHDIPVKREDAVRSGIISDNDFDYLKQTSITLYNKMSDIIERSGFIIADVKIEYGRDPVSGDILLGDSIGPDEFRLWLRSDYSPGRDQESFDKQLLRDWLIKTGFKEKVDNSIKDGGKIVPPVIPPQLLSELTKRYLWAYEQITHNKMSQ
jgi:phosphoribosylaminoimidazole-succinocarboxamide synthase